MIDATTQRLHVRAPDSSRADASDATTNRLRTLGSREADGVDSHRGNASPVVRDRAPGVSESTIEQQAAVVQRLQTTLTETREVVAHLVNKGTTTAGHRDADPGVTGAQQTIMRAPEAQRPQPSSSSAQTHNNGTGNSGTTGAQATQAAAPVNYVMTQAEAEAIAVQIYSDAFPGVGFTRNDLAAAVAQLRTGLISPEQLFAEVHEGAALINNNAGDVAGAQARAPGRHPNRQSTIAQELRLQRLAALMEAGIIPENKFTINGNFSYNQGAAIPKGRFVESMQALQARNAPRGPAMLGRELQRSMERFKTNVTNQQVSQEGNDGEGERRINRSRPQGRVARGIDPNINLQKGNEPLIRGTTRPPAPPVSSTGSTGQPANGAFSVSGASLSDLSELSDEMNDRSSENNTEPPPPPPPSGDPIALDLNHDGKIGTTGKSTAKDHKVENASVAFDLDGDGRRDKTEWMNGDGDGLLVDDHDGEMSRVAAYRGDVDVKRLFGDEGGRFANGYEKLAGFDTNKDGKISGGELDALKVWIDDGDSRLEEGELKTLGELGITELSVRMDLVQNQQGETLMRSTFQQNGQTHMTEDVWFGMDGKAEAGQRGFLEHMKKALTESTAEQQGRMLRRLDAAIVEVSTLNRDIEDRRSHATLGNRVQQNFVAAQLGGMRV